MTDDNRHSSDKNTAASRVVVAFFVVVGLLLIAVSVALEDKSAHFVKELLKELGIVILAVFTISWLYEIAVAKKYFRHFSLQLRSLLETGESNAAACLKLGILRIYASREDFQRDHPITELTAKLQYGDTFRIVARSLFHMTNKADALKTALHRGAHVELCFNDPAGTSATVMALTGLQQPDIQSALGALKTDLLPWVELNKPAGTLEIKTHTLLLFDSFLLIDSYSHPHAALDLSFGRDLTAKRIILLDPGKPLGSELKQRYKRVWDESTKVFFYDSQAVRVNTLL